jgi:ketosteroid isomerase-like protein
VGPEAIMAFWASIFESFDEGGMEIEDVADAGDRAAMAVHSWGRGMASGTPIDTRWALVLHLRDGRISRVDVHGSYAKALEALGMQE